MSVKEEPRVKKYNQKNCVLKLETIAGRHCVISKATDELYQCKFIIVFIAQIL